MRRSLRLIAKFLLKLILTDSSDRYKAYESVLMIAILLVYCELSHNKVIIATTRWVIKKPLNIFSGFFVVDLSYIN